MEVTTALTMFTALATAVAAAVPSEWRTTQCDKHEVMTAFTEYTSWIDFHETYRFLVVASMKYQCPMRCIVSGEYENGKCRCWITVNEYTCRMAEGSFDYFDTKKVKHIPTPGVDYYCDALYPRIPLGNSLTIRNYAMLYKYLTSRHPYLHF
jgi:hypothetical protein